MIETFSGIDLQVLLYKSTLQGVMEHFMCNMIMPWNVI